VKGKKLLFTIRRLNNQNIQQLEQSLQEEFENHFDKDAIEELAHSSQFVQRKGKLNGCTFLSLIVFNTNSLLDESLNNLTIDLQQNYEIRVSKQALHERFNEKSVLFITYALEKLLHKQLLDKGTFRDCDEFKRFLIKDSVCFQVDESLANAYPGSGGGGSKANVRIQFEYDLLNGQIIDLSLNAFNEQDAKDSTATLHLAEEGDLIVRDLAYMHLTALQGIAKKIAHFLCRLNTQRKVYQEQDGQMVELDFAAIVKLMRENDIKQCEEHVWLGKKKDLQVRLFLLLMPQSVYNERLRKANINARKKGHQVSNEFKARAALNLFITSAPEELIDIDTAWKIYTLRWQIELTFKIWKSICKIDKVKKVKKDRLECYIWAKLLMIVLCWRIVWFTAKLLNQYYQKNLSFFKAFKTLMRDMVRIEELISDRTLATGKYLVDFLQLSSKKHILEKKKLSNYSAEVLVSSLTITTEAQSCRCNCSLD
jgi:Transposase DDE domain